MFWALIWVKKQNTLINRKFRTIDLECYKDIGFKAAKRPNSSLYSSWDYAFSLRWEKYAERTRRIIMFGANILFATRVFRGTKLISVRQLILWTELHSICHRISSCCLLFVCVFVLLFKFEYKFRVGLKEDLDYFVIWLEYRFIDFIWVTSGQE